MMIKDLLAREIGISPVGLRHKHLVERIFKQTGWPRPSKKNREEYFIRYYNLVTERQGKDALLPHVVNKTKTVVLSAKRAFYQSDGWLRLRYEALKKSNGSCQCCGATPLSSGKPLHVDHIKPRSKYPELALEITNLQVLCADCNLGKSNRDETDWRKTA